MHKIKNNIVGFIVGVTTTFAGTTLLKPDEISPYTGVGIVISTGSNIERVLNEFTIDKDVCFDSRATTSDCQRGDVVLYQGSRVKVFLAAPQEIMDQNLMLKLGSFPFEGAITYKEKPQDADKRIIQYMEQSGMNSYQIIYEE